MNLYISRIPNQGTSSDYLCSAHTGSGSAETEISDPMIFEFKRGLSRGGQIGIHRVERRAGSTGPVVFACMLPSTDNRAA
jgi:hypothetical protein